ncbi:MAG TPA: hypothetical protein VN521_07305, partial [Negativicutes bacterium]|nr:hypothetical protein [Negativicutes bacterium]
TEGSDIGVKRMRQAICLVILGLLLATLPAMAAPYDPAVVKVWVDDSLWQYYHIGPQQLGGDIIRLYRVKKAEVAILTNNREFDVHTFTPQDSKMYKFAIPHGIPNLRVRLKTWTADDQVWTNVVELRDVGDNITVKAVPAEPSVYSPGF